MPKESEEKEARWKEKKSILLIKYMIVKVLHLEPTKSVMINTFLVPRMRQFMVLLKGTLPCLNSNKLDIKIDPI